MKHEDLILTIRCQQTGEHQIVNEAVRAIVSDSARDLHLALERQNLPSTVVVCSGDGLHDVLVVEKFTT